MVLFTHNVNKIEGTAHKIGDFDGTCKENPYSAFVFASPFTRVLNYDNKTNVTFERTMRHVMFLSVGLLLYHGGRADDFLAVELVNGFIHFLVNDGSGVRMLAARTTRPVRNQNTIYKPITLSEFQQRTLEYSIVKGLASLSVKIWTSTFLHWVSLSTSSVITTHNEQISLHQEHWQQCWNVEFSTGNFFSNSLCLFIHCKRDSVKWSRDFID